MMENFLVERKVRRPSNTPVASVCKAGSLRVEGLGLQESGSRVKGVGCRV